MAKKSDKYAGMEDMFVQQEIDEKTAAFNASLERLQMELREADKNLSNCDSGQSVIEARNERNAIQNEIFRLEQQHQQEIALLKSKQK